MTVAREGAALTMQVAQAWTDGRQRPRLGYDVETNACRLTEALDAEFALLLSLAGQIAVVPWTHVKFKLGEFVAYHGEHCEALHRRLLNLRTPAEELETACRRLPPAVLENDRKAPTPACFLAGVYRVLLPALLMAYREHLTQVNPLADAPTMRLLKQLIRDAEEQIAWADRALPPLVGEEGRRRVAAWQERLQQRLTRRPLTRAGSPDAHGRPRRMRRRAAPKPAPWTFTPVPLPARDPGVFTILSADEQVPRPPGGTDPLLVTFHAQFDGELQALEFFGRQLYEHRYAPWALLMDLARMCWDESRHAQMNLQNLETLGGRAGMFPIRPATGSYAQIYAVPTLLERIIVFNRQGEGGGMDNITLNRNTYREEARLVQAQNKDYELADEITHVRFGNTWFRKLTEDRLEERPALEAAAERRTQEILARMRAASTANTSSAATTTAGPAAPAAPPPLGKPVNVWGKRLAGFTEQEIEQWKRKAGRRVSVPASERLCG